MLLLLLVLMDGGGDDNTFVSIVFGIQLVTAAHRFRLDQSQTAMMKMVIIVTSYSSSCTTGSYQLLARWMTFNADATRNKK